MNLTYFGLFRPPFGCSRFLLSGPNMRRYGAWCGEYVWILSQLSIQAGTSPLSKPLLHRCCHAAFCRARSCEANHITKLQDSGILEIRVNQDLQGTQNCGSSPKTSVPCAYNRVLWRDPCWRPYTDERYALPNNLSTLSQRFQAPNLWGF